MEVEVTIMANTDTSPSLEELDPYLAWARKTDFAAVLPDPQGNDKLRVAIEFRNGQKLGPLVDGWAKLNVGLAPHYTEAMQQEDCRFACADVPAWALDQVATAACRLKAGLIGNAEQQSLPADQRVPMADFDSPALKARAIQQMRGAMSRATKSKANKESKQGRIDGLRKIKVAKPSGSRAAAADAAAQSSQQVVTPVMAVIDFGCAFAHGSFRRPDSGTRVIHFWDQGRDADAGKQVEIEETWPWLPEQRFGYGREANAERLGTLMHSVYKASVSKKPGDAFTVAMEEACYLRAALPELLEPWSHGTAVMGMAAGVEVDASGKNANEQDTLPSDDPASKADLIFVQLPEAAVEDLSGGWITTYVLDAINYAIEKAGERSLVINISLGSHGGPHDGGSLLEAAIEQFMEKHSGLHIVVAAGNAADKRGHAKATIQPGAHAQLRWVVPAGDPTQSFLEFWYRRPRDGVSPTFSVRRLDGLTVLEGSPAIARDADELPCAALWQLPAAPSGDEAGMALLAIAPTVGLPDRPKVGMGVAPPGAWTIEVTNNSPQHEIEVHAWIERDEPGAGPLADRPDSVLKAPPGSTFEVTDESTLIGQATGMKSWVVGGYELRHPRQKKGQLPIRAKESGRGPGRGRDKRSPDLFAPSDRWVDGATRGLRALANRSPRKGQTLTDIDGRGFAALSGTSLSAPWVARQLYNLMTCPSALRSKEELSTALQAMKGKIHPPIFEAAVEWP